MTYTIARVHLSFIFLDAIHYKVREERYVASKTVYCMISVNQEGYRDLRELYIGVSESTKFWIHVN